MGTPPGAAGAGYFGAPAPAKRNDPRPALSPQLEMVFETRRGGDHSIPPPCSTPLVVRDKGSAGPHHMRSTLNLVPQTPALFRKLKLPFGLVINPMAAPGLRDDPIPTVDLGPGGPVRCAECKAYVNAYFRFVADGGRMVCNFCGAEQPVPPGYACPLDMEGRRRDAADRPELCCGSVDMVATAEYMAGGGRLHAFLATLPRRGRPASRPREVPRALADRDALDALHPDGAAWGELAARAAEAQVRPELYCLAAGPYMDVASLDAFARGAAGSLRFYPGFHAPADAARLQDDLRWALARPAGLEAVGRLRVSTGLSVGRCWGAFHRRTPTDLHFPAIDADQALAASIEVDEKAGGAGEAYAQFALLYTSPAGRRLVRVHTLALPITTGRSSAFRGADMDAVLALTARRVAAQAPGKALGACRDAVMAAAVDLLVAYRQHAAQQSDTSQLLLPEALQLLPLFSLGLSKNALFRRGVASWGWNDARLDERALWLHRLLTCPVEAMASIVYEASVFFGKAVPPATLEGLLGAHSLEALGPAPAPLPRLATPLSAAVNALLNEVCRQRGRLLRTRVLPAGVGGVDAFFSALVEDKAGSAGGSYADCLRQLHRAIVNKLS
ncbi:Protein transport protein Sec24-like CEF [Auxenochlorella protothecoides]|uniref:Protein transport protein Sec24-like CEF n=1 Tax=Auxenochlorella protothecoides TaxID=3075 RepID=A0A087SBA6_AUXPR|nr:Protein transport protein Sec24-like CEF [Auxenochlorella protothecoides]KFM23010.1 Protein transport protein Sec24-like CEF [Auxenochlorella protothecoides]